VLLVHHVVVDDVLLHLLAVVAHGRAARPQVGQEFRAVVVELLGQLVGDLVVDEALGDVPLVVLLEILYDQDPVYEILDGVVLQRLELLVELLLVAGLALELGNQGRDLAADVVDRDDLVLGNGGDSVREPQVEVVIRGKRSAPGQRSRGGKLRVLRRELRVRVMDSAGGSERDNLLQP
jgi:hypothetical protein